MEIKKEPRKIILIHKNEGGKAPPSIWDKVEQFSKILSLIGIPLIVAFFGMEIQKQLTDKNLNKDYVKIAVSILSNPDASDKGDLREWAVGLLNSTAPVKFSKQTAESLKKGDVSLPSNLQLDIDGYRTIARNYQNTGNYTGALENYKKALNLNIKNFGTEHPNVATSFNNLASIYASTGDLKKANELYKKSLSIRKKILGLEHPDTATTMVNLASLYQAKGEFDKAEKLYLTALVTLKKVLGLRHPSVASVQMNLANLYMAMGAYDEAEKVYLDVLSIREKVFGEKHPDTALSMISLGNLYKAIGKYNEAEKMYLNALTIQELVFGTNSPELRYTLINLMKIYEAQGGGEKSIIYRGRLERLIDKKK